jgi:hypothetical protein
MFVTVVAILCHLVAGQSVCVEEIVTDLVAYRDTLSVLQSAPTQDQMNVYTISPVIAGSNYPFGNV